MLLESPIRYLISRKLLGSITDTLKQRIQDT